MNLKHSFLIFLSIYLFTVCSYNLLAKPEDSYPDNEVPAEIKDRIEFLLNKGSAYFPRHLDSTFYYAGEAKSLAKKFNDTVALGRAYYLLGNYHVRSERLLVAEDNYLISLDLLAKRDADSLVADIFLRLGAIHAIHNSYDNAMSYLFKALHMAEDLTNNFLMFHIYTWIATTYDEMDYKEGTIRYFNKTIEISGNIGDRYGKSEIYMNLAGIHELMDEFDKAEEYYFMAMDEMLKEDDSTWFADALIRIGNMNFKQGKYDLASDFYNKTIDVFGKSGKDKIVLKQYYLVKAKIGLARDSKVKNNFRKAIILNSDAMDLAKMKGYSKLRAEASYELSQVYEKIGRIDSALFFFKQHKNILDSVLNSLQVSEAMRYELEYNHFRAIQAKKLKRLEIQLAYQKNIQTYQLLIIVGILVTLILVLIFIIFRNRQLNKIKRQELLKEKLENDKENMQNIIDEKNRELTTSVIFLLKKNNFLQSLADDFKNIINENKHYSIKGYQDVLKKLNESLGKDAWEEFEARFNNVHQDFNEKLLKDFPDLTPNELKLCAFLKLNMTSKDIETITYQSNNTITVARHRLRTKLGLQRDENLVTFLAKY